jgi:hypothetical protein
VALLSPEQIEELRKTHGRVAVVTGKDDAWQVVYKKPSRADYKRFRAMSHRPEQASEAQEMLALKCVVHPSAEALDALLEDYPGIPEASGKALGELAGVTGADAGEA